MKRYSVEIKREARSSKEQGALEVVPVRSKDDALILLNFINGLNVANLTANINEEDVPMVEELLLKYHHETVKEAQADFYFGDEPCEDTEEDKPFVRPPKAKKKNKARFINSNGDEKYE